MNAEIKVVIWDLDETFWNGTLSEGEVQLIEANVERVRLLNRRGVVNAICSKNDHATAQAKLEELGLWDQFVFASIQWAPKGAQVRQIIENMQLRAPNVLFVDDNALNREEVAFYNTDIQVMTPEEWAEVDCTGWGKDDSGFSRLNNYRLLENKKAAASTHDGDNEEFLRNSEIVARIVPLDPATMDMDRVVEVLNRTNQLNFTKRRFKSGIAQFMYTLHQSGSSAYAIWVTDRFGEYGLCGVASVSGTGMVEDFAFSCRLLDMGVERAVLRYLEGTHENLTVPFDASGLAAPSDWVQLDLSAPQAKAGGPGGSPVAKVFMPAACFSDVVTPFLKPEFEVTGIPDLLALNTSMVRRGRATSITFWGGKADALEDLFKGEFDILHLHTGTEVMSPPVWLPIVGYFPLPVVLSYGELKRNPDLMNYVRRTLRERGEFLGRDMKDTILRWQARWVLFGSSLFFVSRQARFSAKRYRKRLEALRQRLPARTKLVIGLAGESPAHQHFGGDWAALNPRMLELCKAANAVARGFAEGRSDVFVMEPDDETYEVKDIAGHFSHQENIEIAQRMKKFYTQVMARAAGTGTTTTDKAA